ncbi:MAG: gp436 family protein [Panacagrimonas sp.]
MTYFVRQDYIDRHGEQELIQLTDRDSDGLDDSATLASAIADADNEIDAYVGARYALPLATVPALLKRISRDLVRYNLFDQRAPEEVRLRYQAAIKLLIGIRSGDISLGLPEASVPAGGEIIGGEILVNNQDRIFGRGRG